MSARRSWRPSRLLPKGLYTRSLLIVILPMLLLQSVVALIFMERHWQQTTQRLSSTVAQDIAALIQLREAGVDPACVGQPTLSLELSAFCALFEAAAQNTRNPNFGLWFGNSFKPCTTRQSSRLRSVCCMPIDIRRTSSLSRALPTTSVFEK